MKVASGSLHRCRLDRPEQKLGAGGELEQQKLGESEQTFGEPEQKLSELEQKLGELEQIFGELE